MNIRLENGSNMDVLTKAWYEVCVVEDRRECTRVGGQIGFGLGQGIIVGVAKLLDCVMVGKFKLCRWVSNFCTL